MAKVFIHFSDIHLVKNWEEDIEVVLNEFFPDLRKQISVYNPQDIFAVFSGDFVFAASNSELYPFFMEKFNTRLEEIGLPINQRIYVPGNHDIDIDFLTGKVVEHEGVVNSQLNEKEFNDYMEKRDNLFFGKFEKYCTFEEQFSSFGIKKSFTGAGWNIDDNFGVYCLNTAMCSSGGLVFNSKKMEDRNRLNIDTRSLQKWLSKNTATNKILVMHHPLEWLSSWAKYELEQIINTNFQLVLSGHEHEQKYLHQVNSSGYNLRCAAPPLFTNKKGDLGYALILIDNKKGIEQIKYRQWTRYRKFVSGVNFSNNDDGIVRIIKNVESCADNESGKISKFDIVLRRFEERLRIALQSFSNQPIVWVDPVIRRKPETTHDVTSSLEKDDAISINQIVNNPKSIAIKAFPQFGLTCFSLFLCKEAWKNKNGYWVYLKANENKPDQILRRVASEIEIDGCTTNDIKCIILDSWNGNDKKHFIMLQKLSSEYIKIPIIIMNTINSIDLLVDENVEIETRRFENAYLWTMSRSAVRKLVEEYNKQKYVGDTNVVVSKMISDFEVLNIHRTPLNCITLLKVFESKFDDNPVNRTELINRILYILFNIDQVPRYRIKPDLKDCEFVLGYFCEVMLKTNKFVFSRDDFIKSLHEFCEANVIDLDIEIVFEVLGNNNIIIETELGFCFRFAYWVFYFLAQRMHHNREFADYILLNLKYASFPEVIEFYTGIDRRRNDALKVLIKDINEATRSVNDKIGVPNNFEPLRLLQWTPTPESIENIENEVKQSVRDSRLPDEIKDQYADKDYDKSKPYHQEINEILKDYSLATLVNITHAGARALRNSDYSDSEQKKELMTSIALSMETLSKTLFMLSPILAAKGKATFQGEKITLVGSFGNTFEERMTKIILNIPYNIVNLYKNDLFSRKMGPLFIDRLSGDLSELIRHSYILLLIYQRPRDWKTYVEKYITVNNKNSFFLANTLSALQIEYRYSFAQPKQLEEISFLIKKLLLKHSLGIKDPGKKDIQKLPNNVLPVRDVQ